MTTAALVVAAGVGERFGGAKPKQYAELAGKTVLRRSLEAYAGHARIGLIRAVIHADHKRLYEDAIGDLPVLPPVLGGATRQESCRLGLESLGGHDVERVLIHDAARPLVPAAVIDRTLDALAEADAVVAALPVTDTIKMSEDGRFVSGTVDRRKLWRAQTPQGFRYSAIMGAHERAAGLLLTDDAAVAEAAGIAVTLVEGDPRNMKITSADDMRRAERLLQGGLEIRVGSGFDVHRFAEGTEVRLCGVEVAHDRGLAGHSDADVGLHALTDALLGAVGEGDIGTHFPSTDDRWRGADSEIFLRHAVGLVVSRGGAIQHVDVTLICQVPRIGPHVPAMRERIADLLGVGLDRVSVKATTTDGLGFTGRAEGIAGQAVATVMLA